MNIARSGPIRWLFCGLLLAGWSLSATAGEAVRWTREDAAHLLRRAAFSGTPVQIDSLYALGRDGAVEYLLSGKTPEEATPVFAPVTLSDFEATPFNIPKDADQKQARQMRLRQGRQDLVRYRGYWLDRMLRTDRPLEEKMTLFWHGLLCSGIQEVKDGEMMIQQNKLFHQNALGNYKQLIEAIVHDPAMLRYLDADKNVVGKPNENLARELMELFTMGEGQGYTERDIAEVARALTGMGVLQVERTAAFRPRQHDGNAKTIFGKAGNYRPDDVVGLIFAQPQPAQYLAKKLWEFYAFPNPSAEEIAPVAQALRDSNYELKPALRAIFTSPTFYDGRAKFALIQSPTELCVSTARLLEQKVEGSAIAAQLGKMGQELFQPPNVKGWPGGEQWITAATLFNRYNACTAMVEGKLVGGAGPAFPKPNKPNAAANADQPIAAAANGKAVGNPRMAARRAARSAGQRPGIQETTRAGLISPATLFPDLPREPKADQVVDAAVARFLGRPLHPDKRATLVTELGDAPIKIGEGNSDQRIADMIGLLLSTPEHQVH
jgi:uncharacterized protein (DUF1800 family)